jgi:hypothetical protein
MENSFKVIIVNWIADSECSSVIIYRLYKNSSQSIYLAACFTKTPKTSHPQAATAGEKKRGNATQEGSVAHWRNRTADLIIAKNTSDALYHLAKRAN